MALWDMGLSALLALLLVATIAASVRLDRALRAMRRDRGAFEALVSNLSSANESVVLGIRALREEADRATRQVTQRVEEADKMATDLSFLVDGAGGAAVRLETLLRDARATSASRPSSGGAASAPAESRLARTQRILRRGVVLPRRGAASHPAPVDSAAAVGRGDPAVKLPGAADGSFTVLTEAPLAPSEPPSGPLRRAGITIRRRSSPGDDAGHDARASA
jgi:hypothetical protein